MNINWPLKYVPFSREFHAFLQLQANRFIQGHYRYGEPKKSKRYMTRMSLELKAYRKTGNIEHLANLAVYCGLEVQCPENPKQHFNSFAESVTRGKMKEASK